MCMEDIRLGRSLGGEVRDVSSLIGSGNPILPANPRRTRIIFGCGRNGPVMVAPKGFPMDGQNGFTVNLAQQPLVIRVEEWGSLVWQEWFAADGGAGSTLAAATMTLEKE